MSGGSDSGAGKYCAVHNDRYIGPLICAVKAYFAAQQN
jgi:hypothetical protein